MKFRSQRMVRWRFFGISDFLKWDLFLDIFSQYGVLCNFSRFFTCEWSHLFPIFLSLPKSIPEMKEHIFCAKLQYEFPKCSRSPLFSLLTFLYELQRSEMQKALKMFSSATPSWTANWIHYYSSIMNLTNQFLIGG